MFRDQVFQHKANITDINSVWLFALGEILPNINCEAANHFETSALLTTYKKTYGWKEFAY